MSGLEVQQPTSGGRKARPYDGQVPARKEAIVPLIPALESLNLGKRKPPLPEGKNYQPSFTQGDQTFKALLIIEWGREAVRQCHSEA